MTEPIRLRQIAFAALDLARAEKTLVKVLGSEVIYRDPNVSKWGLENILIPLGTNIIEVVASASSSPDTPPTAVTRFLRKRNTGAAGYMIIMQCQDAKHRLDSIQRSHNVQDEEIIFQHHTPAYSCVQYHPRLIPGGVIPELDSHKLEGPSVANDFKLNRVIDNDPVWHACGSDSSSYIQKMRKHSDLELKAVTIRLGSRQSDAQAAARRWESLFGIQSQGPELRFSNAGLTFVAGKEGSFEGLESVTVGVRGKGRFEGILERASREGLCGDGWIDMLGVKWYFELLGDGVDKVKARL